MSEIKTIDELPRSQLIILARNYGYRYWNEEGEIVKIADDTDVPSMTLAKFISDSI